MQQKEWVKRKNRKSINQKINIHKFDMHGIPLPTKPIKQEQPPGEGRWVKPVKQCKCQSYVVTEVNINNNNMGTNALSSMAISK